MAETEIAKAQRQLLQELFLAFVEFGQHKEGCAAIKHKQLSKGLACTCSFTENLERLRVQVYEHIDTEDLSP